MNTFRPPETDAGVQPERRVRRRRRIALRSRRTCVLETTLAGRWFEINVNTDGGVPMVYTPRDAERQLLQRSGARSQQPPVGRGAQLHATTGAESTCSSSASTSSESRLRRVQREPAGGDPPARRLAGRADRVRRRRRAGSQRHRVRAVRAGPLARRVAPDAGAGDPHGSRRGGRARELVAARRVWRSACCPRAAAFSAAASASSSQRTPLNVGAFPPFESRTVDAVRAGRLAARTAASRS